MMIRAKEKMNMGNVIVLYRGAGLYRQGGRGSIFLAEGTAGTKT